MIDQTLFASRWLALPLLCLGLAGCGSMSSGGNTALNVVMFQSTTPPPADLPHDLAGRITVEERRIITDAYEAGLRGYTYFEQ